MGAPLTVPRRPLTVDEYHAMVDAGILGEDEHIELIAGEIIQMAPIGIPHMRLVNLLIHLLSPQVLSKGVVSPQNPIALPPDDEPEPDIVILRPECLRLNEIPGASEVLLLIEVSVSTVDYDRNVKLPLYAKHSIVEVWMFEPLARSVTIYRDPTTAGYATALKPQSGETISPLRLPEVRLNLSELWL